MSKVQPMKNTRNLNKSLKTKNFKTHKDDRNFGHVNSRKNKQEQRWEAWI